MSGWLRVEDQLPGEQGHDSGDVLVFLMGNCSLTDMKCRHGRGWGVRIGFYDADIRAFRVHGRPEHAVTHWQPLPSPPTE
ncbi:DUF551 domain-containing protein [Pseudomonas sp. UBA6562]|uniref:DUF551 domain-containing protein n=1 Tax=Pseudomonas sp. UBA6562 TaxID=1947332 RepID=UPI0039C8F2DA